MPNFLKIAANSWRVVVLSSKAGAHRSLISDRNLDQKVEGICRIYGIPLYCLIRQKIVFSMSVCKVPMVVYIHKIS
jgi:hypothetical protein